MNDMINTVKGVFLLKDEAFQSILDAENSMKRGIFILAVCFLIAAFPTAVSSFIDNVQPFTAEKAEAFQDQFLQNFELYQQFMPADADFGIFIDQFKENFAMGANIGVAIDALPRPLPRAAGVFFQALGGWISSPFSHLAGWLSYAIWVLLFAKMMGGFGGVNRFLGLTALYAVPNLLGFFGFIPFVGFLISLVGVVWGWIVYVKAVEISQEVTTGKAILLTILPILVVFVVLILLALLTTIGLVTSFR